MTTTHQPVSFAMTREEASNILLVLERAKRLAKMLKEPFDALALAMDITATNANGCPLDLDALLGFPDADFGHDVFGIRRHIDRTTGQLGGGFVPRCAKAQH